MAHFRCGDREIDLERREVRRGDDIISLSANEAGLLRLLWSRLGQVIDRDVLLKDGLGYNKVLNTRAIDQAIWRLRRKIEDEPNRPVYLLSEPGSGYRLALQPALRSPLIGRAGERVALSRWLSEGQSPLWIVGAPGSGRRALACALEPLPAGVQIHTSSQWPDDPRARTLRLSPLPETDAEAMLVERILSLRGSTALASGERAALPALLQKTSGHPSAIEALAQEAVLQTLQALAEQEPPPDEALVEFVCGLPAEILAVASALAEPRAPIPARIAAEALGAAAVIAAFRASAIEAVDQEGARSFFVTQPLARALRSARIAPRRDDLAKLGERCAAHLKDLAQRALADGSDRSREELASCSGALSWLLGRSGRSDLLPVLLASPPMQPPPPLPDPGDDLDAQVAHSLILAARCERADPERQIALIEPLVPLRPSPPVERVMLQQIARALFHRHAPRSALQPIVERLQAVAERLGTPFDRATFLATRAMLEAREERPDLAAEDLAGAIKLLEPTAPSRAAILRANLAALSLREGMCAEGIAWIERALEREPQSAAREANWRLLLAALLSSVDRPKEAWEQLDLADALGTHPVQVEIERAWCEILQGSPERAAVRMRTALGSPVEPEGHIELMLAWSSLARGLPSEAEQWLSRVRRPWKGEPWGLLFTEALVETSLGRAAEARQRLEEAKGRPPLWWPSALAVVYEVIHRSEGGEAHELPPEEGPIRARPVTAARAMLGSTPASG